jgi:hypothetical protein
MKDPLGFQFFYDPVHELGLYDASFVMPLFGPGIRKKKLQAIEAFIFDSVFENLNRIGGIHPDIMESLLLESHQKMPHARSMDIDPDKRGVGVMRSHFRQRFAIPKPDLKDQGALLAKPVFGIEGFLRLDTIAGPEGFECFGLSLSQTPLASNEASNGRMRGVILGRRGFGILGLHRIEERNKKTGEL